MMQAGPDAVTPSEGVVQRIQDRREAPRRQRPFPRVPGEEEDEAGESGPGHSAPGAPPSLEDAPSRIDIHVAGLFLPARQLLPPRRSPITLH